MQITVEKIKNGYLVKRDNGLRESREYCADAQTLFQCLLLNFEGRGKFFGGDSYGEVFVASEAGQKFTAPAEVGPA